MMLTGCSVDKVAYPTIVYVIASLLFVHMLTYDIEAIFTNFPTYCSLDYFIKNPSLHVPCRILYKYLLCVSHVYF